MKAWVKIMFIVACSIVAIVVIVVILCTTVFSAKTVFVRKFGFDLPDGAKVAHYTYNPFGGMAFDIEFTDNDYVNLKEHMDDFFFGEKRVAASDEIGEADFGEFPTNKGWWDKSSETLVYGYRTISEGWNGAKTSYPMIAVTQNMSGGYHLYICW